MYFPSSNLETFGQNQLSRKTLWIKKKKKNLYQFLYSKQLFSGGKSHLEVTMCNRQDVGRGERYNEMLKTTGI